MGNSYFFPCMWFSLIDKQLSGNGKNCSNQEQWKGARGGIPWPPYSKPGAAFRSRDFQEDVLTFQLLPSYALLMHQTADIIYKPFNGNNWSHFIISMSS